MTLHIIGAGVVGKATGEGFRRFGCKVVYTDKGEDHASVEASLHFICTPEGAVPDIVAEFADKRRAAHLKHRVVIRSSVPPGTTQDLQESCVSSGVMLCHNPEFLREAVAESEFLHADRALIGVTYSEAEFAMLANLYRSMQIPVIFCASQVSETVKLLTNAYLATQISWWNEMKGICDGLELNSHQVARLVAMDSRVSKYGAYQHGKPYGGACLPKDVDQVLELQKLDQLATTILEAVKNINIRMGGA